MVNLFTTIKECVPAEQSAHWIYMDIDGTFPLIPQYIRSCTTGLLLCTSGSLDLDIDFKQYHFSPSNMLCLINDHVLRIKSISHDFKACCIIVDGVLWKEIWREMERLAPFYTSAKEMPLMEIDSPQEKMLSRYLEIIREKYNGNPMPYDTTIEKKIFSALLYEVRNIYAQAQTHPSGTDRKEKILQQFILLVTAHFKQERRIEFYASHFKVTPKYLSLIVRRKSGMTASEWIDNYVITEIGILLRTTNMSIKEIADELNFPDQSFFGKYFKRHSGVTPKEYRKQKM